MTKKILIGCDDAAVEMKKHVIEFLRQREIEVLDMGCANSDDHTPYPVIAERVCRKVAGAEKNTRGILICGTGIGMCISANKCRGIRAAVCHDSFSAERSVLSNDCNVVCFGARIIAPKLCEKLLSEWLAYEFVPSPSSVKIAEIEKVEAKYMK